MSVADDWLKTNLAPLLSNSTFRRNGLLIVLFDESDDDDAHGGGQIPWVAVSPAKSKPGYRSAAFYQHESTLRLMLEGLGITSFPVAAAAASNMTEFFTPEHECRSNLNGQTEDKMGTGESTADEIWRKELERPEATVPNGLRHPGPAPPPQRS